MIPLGQFREALFIIAVDDEGIAIIDEHVAHERVLFERVMTRLTSGALESQRLLIPLVPRTCTIRAPGAGLPGVPLSCLCLGFELESFGGAERLRWTPCLRCSADSRTASQALRALAEDLEGLDRGAQVQDALQRIAATTACHAAVKANAALTYEKMTYILDELRGDGRFRLACPHGRPVMLRLTRREIEKNFERIRLLCLRRSPQRTQRKKV